MRHRSAAEDPAVHSTASRRRRQGAGLHRIVPGAWLLLLLLRVLTPLQAAEYVVAPTGDDAGQGTRTRPFRTLGKAASVLQPGDTCLIRGGVYRETVRPARSGEPGRPIRLAAFPGESVTISGADPLTLSWVCHQGSIFRASTRLEFVQLFVDGKVMPEARWPNSPLEDPMRMARATAGQGTDYESLNDTSLPPGDWNGSICLIWPGARWSNATRRVTDYVAGRGFRFDRHFRPDKPDTLHGFDPRRPQSGNPYVLYGCLAALDAPGEWYLEGMAGPSGTSATQRALYLWTPTGNSPAAHSVEVKQRDLAFDLQGLSHVTLQGIRIFAAGINMADATGCLVQDCHLRYTHHFRETKGWQVPASLSVVTGRGNEWRRCSIAYSPATALRLAGEGNRLVECVVHDVNTLGTYSGGLDLCGSVGAVVSRCTITRGGRDLIQHHHSRRIRVEYCDLSFANMLNNDSGALYCWGTDGEGGTIAYNWVHDNTGDATVGIYLDNFCRNFVVHHNVVWNNNGNGITLNSDSNDNLVCHNTLVSNNRPFGTFTYTGKVPTQKGTRVVNNLVNGRMRVDDPHEFVQGELAPEVHHNAACAVDRRGVPVAGSAAIDAGMVMPGVNDGFKGRAPDLGAYEVGGDYWVPGARWKPDDLPAPPAADLGYLPQPPVTERTMITRGLQLWLDAADPKAIECDAQGKVRRWADKSRQGHHALPADAAKLPARVDGALAGRPVVRGSGAAALKVGSIRSTEGAMTLFLVSQGMEAGGLPWQRLIGAFDGKGNDWTAPNWMIMRPGGEKPAAYGARLFSLSSPLGRRLEGITLFGSPSRESQFLAADIAEVLLYDRVLNFSEADAIEAYLKAKWQLR